MATPPLVNKFNATTLRGIIRKDCPKIKITSFRLIEHGWDNVVAEINERYIFRFPKDERVQFEKEIAALGKLKGKITLNIPVIKFISRKQPRYMGYGKIPGVAMTNALLTRLTFRERTRLVNDLANFLFEFHHAITVPEARALGLRDEQPRLYRDAIPQDITKKIKDRSVLDFMRETIHAYQNLDHTYDRLVVLYNDLHNDNMAFDPEKKKLNGIFDFSDVAIGDIHLDFHPLYKFNQKLMEEVVRAYEKLSDVSLSLSRIVVYARLNELADLAEYIDRSDSAVYKKTMERIHRWQGGQVRYED